MRVVLDVNILVRANERSAGLARELPCELLRQHFTILISGEILLELARVLRYPRLQARYCPHRSRHSRVHPVLA